MIVEYKFICKSCGEYNVTKDTFEKFITKNHWSKIVEKTTKVEQIGIIRFKDKCPKCAPDGISKLESLVTLKPKGGVLKQTKEVKIMRVVGMLYPNCSHFYFTLPHFYHRILTWRYP